MRMGGGGGGGGAYTCTCSPDCRKAHQCKSHVLAVATRGTESYRPRVHGSSSSASYHAGQASGVCRYRKWEEMGCDWRADVAQLKGSWSGVHCLRSTKTMSLKKKMKARCIPSVSVEPSLISRRQKKVTWKPLEAIRHTCGGILRCPLRQGCTSSHRY